MATLEIAVQDAEGALIALEAGADRLELCAALGLTGGLTPSIATIKAVVAVGLPVHVLVRNRPGGFVYSAAEVNVMAADIAEVVSAGAAGVVVGALTEGREVDIVATSQMTQVARTAALAAGRSVDVTYHRALDVCDDPVAQLKVLAEIGVDRVLTSGGATKAAAGAEVLAALVNANTGVQIMAGGGVTVESITHLFGLGVDAVHLSAKSVKPDLGPTGPGGGLDGGLEFTDHEIVAAAVAQRNLVSQ